jgi:hypothetical protein
MVVLLNFPPIVGYYGQNRNKEFSPKIFTNNRYHGPYDILKVSTQKDNYFLRYRVPKKKVIFDAFVGK